jgi:hypothetical protein
MKRERSFFLPLHFAFQSTLASTIINFKQPNQTNVIPDNNQKHSDMKNEIRSHLENPRQLEKLYRTNKSIFKRDFSALYPELQGSALADFWNERLHYETNEKSPSNNRDLFVVVFAAAPCRHCGQATGYLIPERRAFLSPKYWFHPLSFSGSLLCLEEQAFRT